MRWISWSQAAPRSSTSRMTAGFIARSMAFSGLRTGTCGMSNQFDSLNATLGPMTQFVSSFRIGFRCERDLRRDPGQRRASNHVFAEQRILGERQCGRQRIHCGESGKRKRMVRCDAAGFCLRSESISVREWHQLPRSGFPERSSRRQQSARRRYGTVLSSFHSRSAEFQPTPAGDMPGVARRLQRREAFPC